MSAETPNATRPLFPARWRRALPVLLAAGTCSSPAWCAAVKVDPPATAELFVTLPQSRERLQLATSETPKAARKTAPRPKVDPRQQRINDLTDENRALKAQIAALSVNRGSSGETIPELEGKIQGLRNELMAIRQSSAHALQIQAERDHLHESVVRLERELETVKRENYSLNADSRQSWFLVGAGVLLGGITLGLIIPRLSWRKRSSWDSF